MFNVALLLLLSGSVRVEVHLVDADDLSAAQQNELEQMVVTALEAEGDAPVTLGRRAVPLEGPGAYEQVIVRPILGPRRLRVLVERRSSSMASRTSVVDVEGFAGLTAGALAPVARALFPPAARALFPPAAPGTTEIRAPAPSLRLPVVFMGVAGVMAIGAAITAASGASRPALDQPGFLDVQAWSDARATPITGAVAIGLTVGAALIAGLAVVAAAGS